MRREIKDALEKDVRVIAFYDGSQVIREDHDWPDLEPPEAISNALGPEVQAYVITYTEKGKVVDVHTHWLLCGEALKKVLRDYRKLVAAPMKAAGKTLVLSKVKDPRADDIGRFMDLRRYAEARKVPTKTMPVKVTFESFSDRGARFRCEIWYKPDGEFAKAEVTRWGRERESYRLARTANGVRVSW